MTVQINGNGTITGSDIVASAALNTAVAAAINSGPIFRVHLSADQTGVNGNGSKVLYNTVTIDTHSGWNAANNRWIAPKAGYYQVNFKATINSSNSTITNAYCMLYKNGVEYARGYQMVTSAGASYHGSNGSTVVYLNGTTDYIEGWILCAQTGSILNTAGSSLTYMDGHYIHA